MLVEDRRVCAVRDDRERVYQPYLRSDISSTVSTVMAMRADTCDSTRRDYKYAPVLLSTAQHQLKPTITTVSTTVLHCK